MAELSHRHKVLLENNDGIVLLNGLSPDGNKFYAYIVMNKASIERMVNDQESGTLVDFADYGQIILQGEGDPNDEVRKYMEDNYNFNHNGI